MEFYTSNEYLIQGIQIFLSLFAVSLLLASLPPVKKFLDSSAAIVAKFLTSRQVFPIADLNAEIRRLNLLRIGCGALITWHYVSQFGLAHSTWQIKTAIVLAALMTVGFLTPLASFALTIGLNTFIDPFNLGAMVCALNGAFFTFLPAGTELSIDAILSRFFPFYKTLTKPLYVGLGPLTRERIAIVKFCGLLSFSFLAAWSGFEHLHCESWRKGLAAAYVLLSEVSNPRFFGLIDSWYKASPWTFVNFCRFSTFGMIGWFLLITPLAIFSRVTRMVAVLWGLAFFFLDSTVLFLVGNLGIFEVIIWLSIFGPELWLVARQAIAALKNLHLRPNTAQVPVSAISATAIPIVAPEPQFSSGPIFRAYQIAFAVCLLASAARLPVSAEPNAIANFSQQTLGAGPIALGMGRVDVFNDLDLATLFIEMQSTPTEKTGAPVDGAVKVLENFSDEQFIAIQVLKRIGTWSKVWGYTPKQLPVLRSITQAMQKLFPTKNIEIYYSVVSCPTFGQLLHYKYEKSNIRYLICDARFEPGAEAPQVFFKQDGLDYALRDSPLRLNANTMDLLAKFPIMSELNLACMHIPGEKSIMAKVSKDLKFMSDYGLTFPPPFASIEHINQIYATLGSNFTSSDVLEWAPPGILSELTVAYSNALMPLDASLVNATNARFASIPDDTKRKKMIVGVLRAAYFSKLLSNPATKSVAGLQSTTQ